MAMKKQTIGILMLYLHSLCYGAFVSPHVNIGIRSPSLLPSRINIKTEISSPSLTSSLSQSLFNDEGDIQGPDKIKSCIPYALPLLDGDTFGHYIYSSIPPLKFLDDLFLAPLVQILQNLPFLSLFLFIILSLGTQRASGTLSRVVRFNAQQAIVIDIALVFPTLIAEAFDETGAVPHSLEIMGSNFVWYVYMSACVYSIVMNLRGKKPDGIPYVSPAADFMTGPI